MPNLRPKTLSHQTIIGQKGVNLIATVVAEMRSIWNPSTIDVGIDGTVELCDRSTGEALGLILQIQSKATDREFPSESESSFDFLCDERDLAHWLKGNVPVILVRSRPRTNEAYWVSVKDYFSDPVKNATRLVTFDKTKDRLTADVYDRWLGLAAPKTLGLYSEPSVAQEELFSNLLPVQRWPKKLYVAVTACRDRDEARELLRSHGNRNIEWIIRGDRLYSFHDLRSDEWEPVTNAITVSVQDSAEWAASSSEVVENDFRSLLNLCLIRQLRPNVWYQPSRDLFYFAPRWTETPNGERRPRSYRASYVSMRRAGRRTVFEAFERDGRTLSCRHMAFEGHFRRLAGEWYLAINPTYYFTSNGEDEHPRADELLSGIKVFEKHRSIAYQLLLWEDRISHEALTDRELLLGFGRLIRMKVDAAIDDVGWASRDDPQETAAISNGQDQLDLA